MTDFAQTEVTNFKSSRKNIAFISSAFSGIKSGLSAAGSKVSSLLQKRSKALMVLLLIAGFSAVASYRIISNNRTNNVNGSQLGVTTENALTVNLDKEFSFNVYDQTKELSDPVRYVISSAQLTKQIIIKGQKANAVKGRTFLILNLKLVNDFDKSLFLNTRNYVRVQPSGTDDRLAPEIHNDTVEVQPLSTKLTRIGLPVDENMKEFTMYVGELEGEKESFTFSF